MIGGSTLIVLVDIRKVITITSVLGFITKRNLNVQVRFNDWKVVHSISVAFCFGEKEMS